MKTQSNGSDVSENNALIPFMVELKGWPLCVIADYSFAEAQIQLRDQVIDIVSPDEVPFLTVRVLTENEQTQRVMGKTFQAHAQDVVCPQRIYDFD